MKSLTAAMALLAASASYGQTLHLNLPEQSLAQSLFDLSKQSDSAIFAPAALLKPHHADAIRGEYELEQALKILLTDTGLELIKDPAGFIIRVKAPKVVIEPPQVFEEIVVTGTYGANRQSLAIKRDEPYIVVDAVSADDIGRLPDINVADSFRRIAGANSLNDSDEGQFVVVRGIPSADNFVSLDGLALASDRADTRAVNLEIVPASAVASLELYKTRSASLAGDSAGGILNLSSHSAFARATPYLRIDSRLSSYSRDEVPDNDDGIGGDLVVDFSQRFGREDQFGIVLGGIYSEKKRDEQHWQPRYEFLEEEPFNPDSVYRSRFSSSDFTNTWTRDGGNLKLEYQSDHNLYASVHGYYYRQREHERRQIWFLDAARRADVTLNENGGASIDRGEAELRIVDRRTSRRTSGLHVHLDWQASEDHQINFALGDSYGRYLRPDTELTWESDNGRELEEALGYSYEDNSNAPVWSLNDGQAASDPNNYVFEERADMQWISDNHLTDSRFDYAFNSEAFDEGWGFGIGARFRINRFDNNEDEQNYEWDGEEDLRLGAVSSPSDFIPRNFNDPSPWLDPTAFENVFNSSDNFSRDLEDDAFDSDSEDFTYRETVSAGYAQVQYQTEQWRVLAGLRYEDTEYDNHSVLVDRDEDVLIENRYQNRFSHWLPSLHASYAFNDDWRVLTAAYRSLARPDIQATNGLDSIRSRRDEIRLSRSNPDIDPTIVDNVDLSVEYLLDTDTALSVAFFHKDVSDYILETDTTQTQEDGPDLNLIQYENIGHGHIRGIELNLTKNRFDFLPAFLQGFGVSANATWSDAELNYPGISNTDPNGGSSANRDGPQQQIDFLPGQTDFTANVLMFYRFWDSRGEWRVGYNYTGEWSQEFELDQEPQDRDVWQPYEQWDTQLRLDMTDNLSLIFQVRNLTDSRRQLTVGEQELLEREIDFGHSYWAGVSYIF